MDSSNPIKGTYEAESYCLQNNMPYEKIPSSTFEKFVEKLSTYAGYVIYPKTLETYFRVVVEDRMVNCKLVTNDWNGCTSESWFADHKEKT